MRSLENQKGFTLIELVLIIVILGVLAVIAIPKFVDISAEASTAALNGVAGGMSSAMATNYAVRKANAAKGVREAEKALREARKREREARKNARLRAR